MIVCSRVTAGQRTDGPTIHAPLAHVRRLNGPARHPLTATSPSPLPTIKETEHPRALGWGPFWDHTLCTMANDLRVCARLAAKNCPQRYLQVGDELVSYVTGIGELRQKFVASPSV